MTDLLNKHAVITGGGSGIGAAIAQSLSKQGVNITIMGRRQEALNKQVSILNSAHAVTCDLTEQTQVAHAFEKATAKFGPVDIMINNAGQVQTSPFHKLSSDQWHSIIDVNLHSVFHCTQLTYPGMRQSGWGRIINIASTAALKGYPYVSAYCAAKHAVVGFTKALALEAAKTGVTVNAICPGYTDTDIINNAVANICKKTGRSQEQAMETFTKTNPQGRLIQPSEVASTVTWLCLAGSESITGQSIAIAGGEVM